MKIENNDQKFPDIKLQLGGVYSLVLQESVGNFVSIMQKRLDMFVEN